ncbi:MAG: DUF3108 domain-containing protein [Betaproteobacteria bacterium]|nr:DUF3108 domain-containing protein [Betaproteobacteria bacterium]
MAREPATSRGPAGSVRLISVAATLSAAMHLFALAALGGLFDAPEAGRKETVMRAVLVTLPPSEPASKAPAATPTPPKQRRTPTVAPPIEISDATSTGSPVVIARSAPSSASAPTIIAGAPSRPVPDTPPPPALSEVVTQPVVAPVEQPITVPRRIFIEYELKSGIADGRARYLWTADTATRRYTIEGGMEADGFFASMFAGRFEQESAGELVAGGLRPARFSLRRGEAQAEVAHFDWTARRIEHRRIRGEHIQPLSDNAQDLQSFLFQFSHEFKRPVTPERVSFAITNARKLELYEFRVAGRERLKLKLGEIEAIHLVRVAPEAGDAYEAWLSPAHEYLPVKIRFMLSGRFPVDQFATRIDIEP